MHFCLGGNLQKTTDIVIDDYIPINSNKEYLFEKPGSGDGIWMILVQKAWAKVLGGYDMLDKMN